MVLHTNACVTYMLHVLQYIVYGTPRQEDIRGRPLRSNRTISPPTGVTKAAIGKKRSKRGYQVTYSPGEKPRRPLCSSHLRRRFIPYRVFSFCCSSQTSFQQVASSGLKRVTSMGGVH